MISVQSGMLFALGFLVASLLGLLVASAFWARAVRLTTKRLKESMPVSEPEIQADRDRLRAEYAVKVHKLSADLEQAKLDRARHLIEINRRDASISALETAMGALRAELEENLNARRVLEQTVADRLPKVEARLAEAKRVLFNRDREIAELTQSAKRQKLALEEASSLNAEKAAQIDRLNSSLAGRDRRGRRGDGQPAFDGEAALRAEVENLRIKSRDQAALIDRLQQRLAQGALSVAAAEIAAVSEESRPNANAADGATGAATGKGSPAEIEVRSLRAKIEDQAGEIARLKAALAAFEQADASGRIVGNSKLALKARAGSAEAQNERQASTISKLRAELATAHERLAQQASHDTDEMRRMGVAPGTAAQASDGAARRRNLVDRVAHVRPALRSETEAAAAATTSSEPAGPSAEEHPADHGHRGNGGDRQAGEVEAPPAAQMPKTAAIEDRPKLRLLDRLTSLTKSSGAT